jgi:serine/threonine protein kinase
LGELLAWLLDGGLERHDPGVSADAMSSISSSPLHALVRDLCVFDPAERPSAREVCARLDAFLTPLDATGNWTTPRVRFEPPSAIAPSLAAAATDGAGTLVLDAGVPQLGRFRLLGKLGEGAQGLVYRAEDSANGSIVAIKVLRTDRVGNLDVLKRFRKEARLMAQANNPHVVNLIEFNEDDGIPYMVLEFVAGKTLGELLQERTRLDEGEALAILAAAGRGLREAHERGIVHRDIKPSNILLVERNSLRDKPERIGRNGQSETTADSSANPPAFAVAATELDRFANISDGPMVKVSDFGLARQVVETESLALTAAGALLGTPHYMAPEQWTGRSVDARTDVYAMGATLFHLLAGRPPFVAETRDELCEQHCHAPPPRLRKMRPELSEAVERVVERALRKDPDDRFYDAGQMLHELESISRGMPSDLSVHPRLPECDPKRILQFEFRWDLESSPRALWPLVTNTDRLDRAIGFAPVTKTTRYEPGRGVRTFSTGQKAGMLEVGEEHPYEWVEPRRMGVLREYSQGPFRWVLSDVELLPNSAGGTTLVHRLRLEPASWKIRVGSRFGVGVGMRKSLERVYRRIDRALVRQKEGAASSRDDPFEEAPNLPAPKRQRLERALDRLVERGILPQVVDRLGEHLAFAPPQELARMRPIALANRWGQDPEQVAMACLHGAREGLLELHWDLLCPVCRISCSVADTLRDIGAHAHCEACHLDFELDFANSIELIFRAHPEIRLADLGVYCIGGPAHSPHVLAQVRVAAGERMELDLELAAGTYRLRGPQLPSVADFRVEGTASLRRWDIDLGALPDRPAPLRPGGQTLALSNPHAVELIVRIERMAAFGDALTAARATSMAVFRELFPSEVLAPGQLATVSMVSLMVTALDQERVDELYRERGDVLAFGAIHEHIQAESALVRAGGGAVVKTLDEGILATFDDVERAVKTALELLGREEHAGGADRLRTRISIHRGATLAATVNDQLDYFGATARLAAKVVRSARTGELVLTEAVSSDPGVAVLLNSRGIEGEVVTARGSEHPRLLRVRLGEA